MSDVVTYLPAKGAGGGVNVTDSAVSGYTISIPSVTGDVVITAAAQQQGLTNLFPGHFYETDGVSVYNEGRGYKSGIRFSRSQASEVDATAYMSMTGYLAVEPGDLLTVTGAHRDDTVETCVALQYYDSTHTIIGNSTTGFPPLGMQIEHQYTANGEWTIPEGVSYIRIGCDTSACVENGTLTVTLS